MGAVKDLSCMPAAPMTAKGGYIKNANSVEEVFFYVRYGYFT